MNFVKPDGYENDEIQVQLKISFQLLWSIGWANVKMVWTRIQLRLEKASKDKVESILSAPEVLRSWNCKRNVTYFRSFTLLVHFPTQTFSELIFHVLTWMTDLSWTILIQPMSLWASLKSKNWRKTPRFQVWRNLKKDQWDYKFVKMDINYYFSLIKFGSF